MVKHGKIPDIPGHRAEGPLLHGLRGEVANLLRRTNDKFPGAQPVSFARKHLNELSKEDYFLCEKTDGIRCLLYATEDENKREIHYLIDRKNDYYFVPGLHLPHHVNDDSFSQFHTNTILDGELVIDIEKDGVEKLRYLVFDCLLLDGELLTAKTFDKRIGRTVEFIQKPLTRMFRALPEDCADMPFEVKLKGMDKPYGFEAWFTTKLPSLPHGNDGLIFTAKNAVYTSGTDEKILKWKPPHENTVDFKLKLGEFPMINPQDGTVPYPDYQGKPNFELYIYFGKDDYRHYADMFITDEEWAAMKRLNQPLDGRVVECYIDDESRWRYKKEPHGGPRFRDDKPDANHVSTLYKVVESIEDGVTEKDLCSAGDTIRDAWKHRHPEEDRQKRMQAQQAQQGRNGHH